MHPAACGAGGTLSSLPANVANLPKLEGVSGTLWNGQIARLQYASESVNQLRWDLNGWSLLRFAPEVAIRFGDRNGLNGGRCRLEWRRLRPGS